MEFVAIDFETANRCPQSACSVGLVRFDGEGRILDRFYTLIKPPAKYSYFLPEFINIHGIRPSDVEDAPFFDEIWHIMLSFMGDSMLVAHNARFDVNVLKSLLDYFNCPVPKNRYLCTLEVSRSIWPSLSSHALTSLSCYFDLPYQAHNALDDAANCGKILCLACKDHMATDMELRKFLIVRGVQVKALNI
ncbi:MAG: 3'-5' exonuclease [Sphaerochaetaceae bacterium]|nr:3'-5' exonuclease [Sphaerochaetaceae bacterium]